MLELNQLLKGLSNEKIVTLIRKSKKDYINDKINLSLANPSISAKKWWSITKSLYNNKHCSSIRVLLDEGKLISDSKQKTFLKTKFCFK